MSYLVDTNILVLHCTENIIDFGAKSQKELEKYKNLKVTERVIPSFILQEFNNVYQRKVINLKSLNLKQREAILMKGNEIIQNQGQFYDVIICDKATFLNAKDEYLKQIKNGSDDGLSLVDLSLVKLAIKNNYKILTLDKKVKKLYNKLHLI